MQLKKIRQSTEVEILVMHSFEAYLYRKRIKNINIRINSEGLVCVSAPLKCNLQVIRNFLQNKQQWILHHRTQLLNRRLLIAPQIQNSNWISILGKNYEFIIHDNAKSQAIILEDNHILCHFKANTTDEKKQIIFRQWQRNQLKTPILDRLQKWEKIIGVKVNRWIIKTMKTRWGSCNPLSKQISLNLYLIHFPIGCVEYVIVHELVHLLEASHNKRFYALMAQFMPEWKRYSDMLKKCIINA